MRNCFHEFKIFFFFWRDDDDDDDVFLCLVVLTNIYTDITSRELIFQNHRKNKSS